MRRVATDKYSCSYCEAAAAPCGKDKSTYPWHPGIEPPLTTLCRADKTAPARQPRVYTLRLSATDAKKDAPGRGIYTIGAANCLVDRQTYAGG